MVSIPEAGTATMSRNEISILLGSRGNCHVLKPERVGPGGLASSFNVASLVVFTLRHQFGAENLPLLYSYSCTPKRSR